MTTQGGILLSINYFIWLEGIRGKLFPMISEYQGWNFRVPNKNFPLVKSILLCGSKLMIFYYLPWYWHISLKLVLKIAEFR